MPDPARRDRLAEIRDNLIARIARIARIAEGWLGEDEGLHISLTGANEKLTQIDRRVAGSSAINLGMSHLPAQPIPQEVVDGKI